MTSKIADIPTRQTHTWLRKLKIAFAPGVRDPVAENFARDLMAEFRASATKFRGAPDPIQRSFSPRHRSGNH